MLLIFQIKEGAKMKTLFIFDHSSVLSKFYSNCVDESEMKFDTRTDYKNVKFQYRKYFLWIQAGDLSSNRVFTSKFYR